jgi:hypothetical protein
LAALSANAQQWPGRDNTTKPKPVVAYFQGSLDNATAISAWIEENRFPGIWKLDEHNFADFTHASRRTVMLAVDPANVTAETEEMLRRAAFKWEHSKDFIFGVVDGASWSEELKDFNIYKSELPRVLVTEDNFDVWMEDVHQLRAASLIEDLQSGVIDGALLKQSRTTLSKVYFYLREGSRYADRAQVQMKKGPIEAITVVVAFVSLVMLILLMFWALFKLCGVLLAEPDEYDYAQYRQDQRAQYKPKAS